MTDRPLGPPVQDFTPPVRPDGLHMEGRFARLAPLNAAQHAAVLFRHFAVDDSIWDYIHVGPFASEATFAAWAKEAQTSRDPVFYAIKDVARGEVTGIASFLRIAPEAGSIEVGFITMSPALQRTPAATEAMAMMMGWAFEAGYRRYEWKCDALNAPSRRAAQRLGLSYEGIFRQAVIVKGRNRDTAWFAAIDKEWPALKEAYATWLSPQNFDADGRQKQRLSELTAPIRVASDPG